MLDYLDLWIRMEVQTIERNLNAWKDFNSILLYDTQNYIIFYFYSEGFGIVFDQKH
jgi:hypothetical protein